jgi:hypothetical protein
MGLGFGFSSAESFISLLLFVPCCSLVAQDIRPVDTTPAREFPDAPQAQFLLADSASDPQQPTPQTGAGQTQTEHDKAEQQMKEQEKQRVLGIVPAFNTSYRSDAVSLTGGQKMRLAFRSSIDPFTFAGAFLVAGYHEGMHDDVGFPWGAKGYFERSGAAYLDAFSGGMIGNGILPSLLHQDPRYFRIGHGSTTHRLLYAAATSFICKHDKSGKWEPNYSNLLGNIAAGGISNLYYPSGESGIGTTFENGFVVTAEGAVGSIFQEFWPDISRKILHKDPTNGLDAQARAADQAAKQKRQGTK